MKLLALWSVIDPQSPLMLGVAAVRRNVPKRIARLRG